MVAEVRVLIDSGQFWYQLICINPVNAKVDRADLIYLRFDEVDQSRQSLLMTQLL